MIVDKFDEICPRSSEEKIFEKITKVYEKLTKIDYKGQ